MVSFAAPVVSLKQLKTSCFRRPSTARPPYRLVCYETCARVDKGRCRWAPSPHARREGVARRSRRLPFGRGTRCCCSRLIDRTDCASLATISAARVPRSVPMSSWSWSLRDQVHADPSRLEGPRCSTILVETAGDRRYACCERAVRLRRHGRRVERAARREASISCLTAVLWL